MSDVYDSMNEGQRREYLSSLEDALWGHSEIDAELVKVVLEAKLEANVKAAFIKWNEGKNKIISDGVKAQDKILGRKPGSKLN